MGLVSGNRLNRFWKKGVKPIKDAIGVLTALSTVDKETLVGAINELAEGKFDVAKLVASTNITEPGFAMDGKTASEAITELYSNLSAVTEELKGKVIFHQSNGLEMTRMSLYKDSSNLYYIQLVLTINGDQKVINLSNFRL